MSGSCSRRHPCEPSTWQAECRVISRVDLIVVGAGPAGMATAIAARGEGLSVAVIDDQPMPGGQIWRNVEAAHERDGILGQAYVEGRAVAERFRACGADYQPGRQLWKIEEGFRAFLSRDRVPEVIEAEALVLAAGAQERPVPFPGWTLPGVLTVGAAQILLKASGQVPEGPLWIAGSGPLPLLYATQLLAAGGQIAGYVDTTPSGRWRSALRHLPGAARSAAELLKGLKWTAQLRSSGIPVFSGVTDLEAVGEERLRAVRFRTRDGKAHSHPASVLLVHEGVVPNIHTALSLDCELMWNDAQDCFHPVLDEWGETSRPNLFIVGDGAGIGGAKVALLRGELAGVRVSQRQGRISEDAARSIASPIRRALARELAIRPFLDAMFRPRTEVFLPHDRTIVCRCEGVTAGEVRSLARLGRPGPNQVKSASRSGMGPCQGRQCGYTVTRLLADAQNRPASDVGFYHVRPPLRPVTLGELAIIGAADNEREQQVAHGGWEE